MNENLKAFLEAAQGDPDLCGRLRRMGAQELVAAANERGFKLTEGDLKPPTGELGEEELGNVTGGGGFCFAVGFGWGTNDSDGRGWSCSCPIAGNGGASDDILHDSNCGCVAVGWGTSN